MGDKNKNHDIVNTCIFIYITLLFVTFSVRPKKICLFRVMCQKNIDMVGTIFFSFLLFFFTLKSHKLYYKDCIFLVFSENVEKKLGFPRKSRYGQVTLNKLLFLELIIVLIIKL